MEQNLDLSNIKICQKGKRVKFENFAKILHIRFYKNFAKILHAKFCKILHDRFYKNKINKLEEDI